MLFITPKEILEKLPVLIRKKRIGKELTQAELAVRANVSLASLRKFEQKGQISLESFIKLAFVLDLAEPILQAIQDHLLSPKTIDEVIVKNTLERIKTRKRVRK